MITTIRNAGKALIIKNDKILLIKHQWENEYYTLPGGGQDHNESLHDCVKRECFEEVGLEVEVGELLFVSEYIRDHDEKSMLDEGFHQVDIFFECFLLNEVYHDPTETDGTQVGFEWVDVQKLMDITLYPMALREKIVQHHAGILTPTYLGELK